MITETERLVLRKFEPEDAEALHPVFADPEATRFTLRIHSAVDQTREWIEAIRKGYERCGFAPWAVVRKCDNRVVGYCGCGVIMLDGRKECEIGYRIVPSCWGQGLATEATKATIGHAFAVLPYSSIVALIQPGNTASIRVAEKSGMIYRCDSMYEGHLMRVYEITSGSQPGPTDAAG